MIDCIGSGCAVESLMISCIVPVVGYRNNGVAITKIMEFKLKSIIILFLVIIPATVFADCIITDFSDKFEVVCSGYNPTAPPKKVNKSAKAARGKPAMKMRIADRESITSAVGMTEEELKFMQESNKMDGYRGKPKRRVQTAKN
jgi:hypothetical protein